ncbi:MAG: class I SAM-dependent methyltransferase [Patescibacteria group bacterium]
MKFVTYIIFSLPILYFLYLVILYFRSHVPFVTTARRYVPVIFKEVSITSHTVLFDLGCGKGDFLFEAEKYHPKELIGFELSPLHVCYAWIKAKLIKSKVAFVCRDFFSADISRADMIYLFLVKPVLDKTWSKIKKECRTGTVVLTLADKIDGEKELKEIVLEPDNPQSRRVWVYQV